MMNLLISKREMQSDDIVVLDLVDPDSRTLPAFQPGAHIDIEVEPGLVRQYSLCSDPAERNLYRLGILKSSESRGGSRLIHERFREGELVRAGEPRNLFPLNMDAPQSILVGGGIGVTPMISMAYALYAAGKSFELHYCVRTRSRAAFLQELASAPFAHHVYLHFDDEEEGQRFNAAAHLPDPANGSHVYVCGPAGFMTWLHEQARSRGFREENLHQEFFNAEVSTQGKAFEVVLARSGKSVTVPEGQTIVAALSHIGVRVNVSCEQGICGTCLCTVLSGEPDHRDSYLTDEEKAENDQIMVCCSRSKGPTLVLDL